jgi:hypothetical protein
VKTLRNKLHSLFQLLHNAPNMAGRRIIAISNMCHNPLDYKIALCKLITAKQRTACLWWQFSRHVELSGQGCHLHIVHCCKLTLQIFYVLFIIVLLNNVKLSDRTSDISLAFFRISLRCYFVLSGSFLGGLFPGLKRGRGVTLITHPHLVPRSRISRICSSSPPQALPWPVVGQL